MLGLCESNLFFTVLIVDDGHPIFAWQRTTPVIVGWFMGHLWKENFCSIDISYTCGGGPRVGDSCCRLRQDPI